MGILFKFQLLDKALNCDCMAHQANVAWMAEKHEIVLLLAYRNQLLPVCLTALCGSSHTKSCPCSDSTGHGMAGCTFPG